MRQIKTYKLYLESYEEIMKDMVSTVDIKAIELAEKQIENIKIKIDSKKKDLELRIKNLEKLQIDTYTDENKEIVKSKTKEISDIIEKLKLDIKKYQDDIQQFKDKITTLKKQKNS